MMKRIIWLCALILFAMVPMSQAAPVSKIIGVNADATGSPPPLLLTLTLLCDGAAGNLNCPQYFAPDITDPTGDTFYGLNNNSNTDPRCVKSTNGGGTWAACPSNAFATIDVSSQAYFGLTRTGAILMAANVAANTCEIRRSSDGGTSWSTVFTSATAIDCGNVPEATSDLMKCSQTTDYCVMLGANLSIFFDKIPIESYDDGVTWTPGLSLAFGGFNGGQPIINVSVEGNSFFGVGTTMRSTGVASLSTSSLYVISGLWTGMTPGDTSLQSGALIMGGSFFCVCGQIATGSSSPLTLRNGADGSISKSFFMADMGFRENGPTFIAQSIAASTAYVMSLKRGTTQYNVWVTQDGFATNPIAIGTFTVTNSFGGCCRGDTYFYGGRVLFTSGGAGGDAQLMGISR